MEKCQVCGNEYSRPKTESAIFLGNPPVCSGDCFLEWISEIDHSGDWRSCWIPGCLEVHCHTKRCLDCPVFEVEAEVFKRGSDKKVLIGSY